jgi:hypothetical protein
MPWRSIAEVPADRQVCHILLDCGLAAEVMILSLPYFAEASGWMDLFATPEAGRVYKQHVRAWIPEEEFLTAPDEFEGVYEH